MYRWSERGRENELVISSPGFGEAPNNPEERDPLKHHLFWGPCNHWVVEYPDAMTWGGADPDEFYDEDLGEIDEDEYDGYQDEEYDAAVAELLARDEIPNGSYVERGVGYASNKEIFTKGKDKA